MQTLRPSTRVNKGHKYCSLFGKVPEKNVRKSDRALDLKKGVAAGVAATVVMTLFSDMVSKLAERKFREPDLLGNLIRGWNPSMKKTTSQVLGWQAHFSVGVGWSLIYQLMKKKSPFSSPVAFGVFSGISALVVWKSAFDLNPNPPKTDYQNFYLQLFLAHMVFGLALHASYSSMDKLSHRIINFQNSSSHSQQSLTSK